MLKKVKSKWAAKASAVLLLMDNKPKNKNTLAIKKAKIK